MIEYRQGDILQDDSEALVNTVNCVGIMGRGIALQFKNAFPENFKAYVDACAIGDVQPGRMFVFATKSLTNPKFIINFPTKRHWKGKSKIDDIESGLEALVNVIQINDIQSIAIPPLGTGLGGLNWSAIKLLLEKSLQPVSNINIHLYLPQGAPDTALMKHSPITPSMTPGRAALIELMANYLQGLLVPFVTLLEIHKLLYFLQEAGEQLNLNYIKGLYGPYANNLRHVLSAIEGYFVTGYADGGDSPYKRLQVIPGAIEEAKATLLEFPNTYIRLNEVSEFVSGYESPFGLELLSTIYWILKNEEVQSMDEVINCTYKWNGHKQIFTKRQIKIAVDTVLNKGWVKNHSLI